MNFLDLIDVSPDRSDDPLILPWPSPGKPSGFLSFATYKEWQDFVGRQGLSQGIPEIVASKFQRAQKLYLLGWIDLDLIKAGELVALTALELALKDRYGKKTLAHLLKHMVEEDGLTDEKVPIVRRCGGSIVGQLTGRVAPGIAEIRNCLAHGDPFDGLPWSGLLELVRDLIHYAYRDAVANGRQSG